MAQILAIERFTDKKYEAEAQKYLKINAPFIQKNFENGIISAFWSRGDRPGTVLMMDVTSKEVAKEVLSTFSLVKKKIITYSLLPLEPYQVQEFLPEAKEEKNFLLIYASAEVGLEETKSILEQKEMLQKRNNQIGITGVLLYENGSFFQVLEGSEKKVNATYKRIANDPRHKNIVKIATLYTDDRQFSDYTTGYASITSDDLAQIEGFKNFFADKNTFLQIQDEQLKNLLNAFKSGRWRQK
jgi:hypothetical protein